MDRSLVGLSTILGSGDKNQKLGDHKFSNRKL